MKRNKFLAALLPSLLLCGCKMTNELYEADEYKKAYFEENYYENDEFLDAEISSSATLDSTKYFNGDPARDFKINSSETRAGPLSSYPSIFDYDYVDEQGNKQTKQIIDSYYTQSHSGDDSGYIGTDFGRTKCMVKQDDGFKKGLLSKLYDGQMFCYNYHNAALVQASANGFGHHFGKQMVSGDYFMLSLRGGSTLGLPRMTSIDLDVTFYKETSSGYEGVNVKLKEVYERTDSGGESCTFVGFKFSDALPGYDTKGICGYRLGFSNLSENDIATSPDEEKESYWGMLVYELMFVDASWA